MSSPQRTLIAYAAKVLEEPRNVVVRRVPYSVPVQPEVIISDDFAHAGNLPLWNRR